MFFGHFYSTINSFALNRGRVCLCTCVLCCVFTHAYVCAQTLAINRGESLKILTVKVNIPDRVKSDFTRWCINNRSETQ